MANSTPTPAPVQLPLDLGIEVEKTVEGMEMGVLQNGMPYLTQRGLAAMSGAARAVVIPLINDAGLKSWSLFWGVAGIALHLIGIFLLGLLKKEEGYG